MRTWHTQYIQYTWTPVLGSVCIADPYHGSSSKPDLPSPCHGTASGCEIILIGPRRCCDLDWRAAGGRASEAAGYARPYLQAGARFRITLVARRIKLHTRSMLRLASSTSTANSASALLPTTRLTARQGRSGTCRLSWQLVSSNFQISNTILT